MRVALVHDYWVHVRGGERVFLAFTRMFPDADCYALVGRRDALAQFPAGRRLHISGLRHVPFASSHFRAMLPLYPWAARQLDLRGYDLVLSSSSGFCHGARTDGVHVCYCYSPLRYAWHQYEETIASQRSPLRRAALKTVLDHVRRADYAAAQRVSEYIAISRVTQARIRAYYGKESTIVPALIELPPSSVLTSSARPTTASERYFLVISQLLPYKRVDLAVQACTRLGCRLVVVGDGPERAALERMAGPTVTFYSRVDAAHLAQLYAGCDALLQCGVEDFGLTPIEANAHGRPALVYGEGGALDTMIPGVTGAFFTEQSPDAVTDALVSFDPTAYDPQVLRAHAEQFDEAHFAGRIHQVIAQALDGGALPALVPAAGRSTYDSTDYRGYRSYRGRE